MNNEIEQIAQQNDMSVEFVRWFFSEKKAACGEHWFLALGAMWEGWKAREGEVTTLALTLEKSREASGCPAGVDLQDWVKQLAAENVALKEYRPEPYGIAMMEALDAFFADEEVPERAMMEAFEILCAKRMPVQATDRIVAEAEARGVEKLAMRRRAAAKVALDEFNDVKNHAELESEAWRAEMFASELREGADK